MPHPDEYSPKPGWRGGRGRKPPMVDSVGTFVLVIIFSLQTQTRRPLINAPLVTLTLIHG